MQTILGSGGTIGTNLAKELNSFTNEIRLVSRNPKKINATDQLFPADLTNSDQIDKAVEGSDTVYLTVGLDYSLKAWKTQWPPLMENTIKACIKHKAKLVFFDNVYLYDRNEIPNMKENGKINPISEKGKIRANIAKMITDKIDSGELTALIARSADFYGPNNDKSFLMEAVYKNIKTGKKPMWFSADNKIHSFTYTPDAAKATALLGNTTDAFNQVWHLPTSTEKLTGKQWVELFASEMKAEAKYSVLPKFMTRLIGLFVPFLAELVEMLYQYEQDYFFDSTKFSTRFPDFKITSYSDGVKASVTAG